MLVYCESDVVSNYKYFNEKSLLYLNHSDFSFSYNFDPDIKVLDINVFISVLHSTKFLVQIPFLSTILFLILPISRLAF